MKQPKKLTLSQKKLLVDLGLSPKEWMNLFEDDLYLHIVKKDMMISILRSVQNWHFTSKISKGLAETSGHPYKGLDKDMKSLGALVSKEPAIDCGDVIGQENKYDPDLKTIVEQSQITFKSGLLGGGLRTRRKEYVARTKNRLVSR